MTERREPLIDLEVDLTEAPLRRLGARLKLRLGPGEVTLRFPKWIPGEHAPSGPIGDLAGIELAAGGRRLGWERDPLDLFSLRVSVPPGVEVVEARVDALLPREEGTSPASPATSDRLAVLSWNHVVLYPAGRPAAEIVVRPSVRLPAGWSAGSALEEAARDGDRLVFAPVSLDELVDSPLFAGRFSTTIALPEVHGAAHSMFLVADSEAALGVPEATREAYRKLVVEAGALFGARHYRRYRFLVSLSDAVPFFGLEHPESSDNRLPERAFLEATILRHTAELLPHELVHSWNGKHRRPRGLGGADFHAPLVGDLLWVYEGLTCYLATLLTARCGLWTPEEALDYLAYVAAGMESRPGRAWRSLADTARSAQLLYGHRSEGAAWRRGTDFYDEGLLVWLEVDARLRRWSPPSSIDAFSRRFLGGESGPPELRPYDRDELISTLADLAPADWEAFFAERVDRPAAASPARAFEAAGWRLVYGPRPNLFQAAVEEADEVVDLRSSLGLSVGDKEASPEHGRLRDVVPGSPAALAGAGPGMRLLGVDGRLYTKERLEAALARSGDGSPLELLLENAGCYRLVAVAGLRGPRHPHLERIDGAADLLSPALAPLAS